MSHGALDRGVRRQIGNGEGGAWRRRGARGGGDERRGRHQACGDVGEQAGGGGGGGCRRGPRGAPRVGGIEGGQEG